MPPEALVVAPEGALASAVAAECEARGLGAARARGAEAAEALPRRAPTHVFWLEADPAPFGALLAACSALSAPPRVLFLSRSSQRALDAPAGRALADSGLPFTVALPPPVRGLDGARRQGLRDALPLLAKRLGAHGFADRRRSIGIDELAWALVHAALNYTTIGRALDGAELRRQGANRREHFFPKSTRDTARWS